MDHLFIDETPSGGTATDSRAVGPAEEFAIHVIACGHCKSFPRDLCPQGRALLRTVELDSAPPGHGQALEVDEDGLSPVEAFAIHVVGCSDCKQLPRNLCPEGILLFREMIRRPGLPAQLIA